MFWQVASYEVDLYVDADLAAMSRVWLGDISLATALREKKVRLSGTPTAIREFPGWLPTSHYAKVPRPSIIRRGSVRLNESVGKI